MVTESQLELLAKRSLLTLLFSQDEIATLLPQLKFAKFQKSQMLIHEGQPCTEVFIPVSGELELLAKVGDEFVDNGVIPPGRAVNVYAFVRGLVYQYSARIKSDSIVCCIPIGLISSRLKQSPNLSKYLLAMTESYDFRSIAKEIDSIGCSSEFKVQFVSSLQAKEIRPQEWLLSPQEPVTELYYLLEGQLVQQRTQTQDGRKVVQATLPARTWLAWTQFTTSAQPKFTVKSVSNSKLVYLSKSDFNILAGKFKEDLDLFTAAILNGNKKSEEDDGAEEEIDIDEIIGKSITPRKLFWQSYPHIQQSDTMDCGPACLAMISAYYNHNLSVQFWRGQLSTSREGTSLFDLAVTTERCGFTSYSLQAEDLRTFDSGFLPCIALRQYHYLVVYKVTKNHLIVGDPGIGIRKMTHEEFAEGFEQAVLFLKPTEAFFSIPESKSQYSHYFNLISGLKKEMALNLAVSILIVALGLFTPVISQIFMDDILVRKDLDLLKLVLAGAGVIAVLNGFLSFARAYYSNYLAVKFEYKANSAFIKKMLSLNYKYFADRHVGDFTRRLHELTKVKHFLLHSFEKVVISLLSLALYASALLFYAPTVAFSVFAATPVFFFISWIAKRKLTSVYQTIFKEGSELESNLTDVIKGIATVKTQQAELASRWRYEEKLVALLKADRSFTLTSSSIGVVANFYSQFVNFALMGLASYMAIKGDLTPGQVIATTMLAGQVLTPMTSLAEQLGELIEIKAVFGRLNDVLLAQSEQTFNRGRLKKEFLRGEIEFKDVWFRYGGEGSDWVLKGISFKIEPGQSVAFVGPSGSGKSTVAALLTRMFEPTKGQIFVDGRDYLDYDVYWLRSQIGVLQQESHLFKGSILENIGFSEPSVDVNRAAVAARKAAALEFISNKPGQFGYMIAPGGLGLSGGEKQRIALARTLYLEPKMLILDEATSALDGIAEHELLTNLSQHTKMTTINIAHRYSTVKYSDFVLVLKDGKVLGFGTHQELAEENQIYRQLFGIDKFTATLKAAS